METSKDLTVMGSKLVGLPISPFSVYCIEYDTGEGALVIEEATGTKHRLKFKNYHKAAQLYDAMN